MSRAIDRLKERAAATGGGDAQEPRPALLDALDERRVVMCDVRDELRAGREPFSTIMAARATVPDDGVLVVRATFEPAPLYTVMRRQGMTHWTERRADDDWLVWFYREAAAPAPPAAAPAAGVAAGDDVVVLDVRGLEPPEPMTRTLAALGTLPHGATLVQLNARVPQFLLPVLEERGYTYDIHEQGDDGVVRLFIRRGDAAVL